jgi:1-acyl-sn-glycerol-3-phosphate acyltransferase
MSEPGVFSPAVIRFFARVIRPFVRVLHRSTIEGLEHLPATGPFVLVGNHPLGFGFPEIGSLMALYAHTFGTSRPLAGFAHPLSFSVWPVAGLYRSIGTIPSTYEAAETALKRGVPICVLPGGDHEALRPFWQFDRVDFGGRVGFLRIAQKASVPIVPLGFRSMTALPVGRSRLLSYLCVWPRVVGVKRWSLSVSGLLVGALILCFLPIAWPFRAIVAALWLASPFALFPCLPATIRIRIGPPIPPEALFGDAEAGEPDEAILRRALARVESAIQAQVESAPAAKMRAARNLR